jgi:predicted enzyme related to lactoylglutathione lyase
MRDPVMIRGHVNLPASRKQRLSVQPRRVTFGFMFKVSEVAFSCYAVQDMARARRFYESVLNLQPAKVTDTPNGQWVEYEIGPHTLALGSAPGFNPSPDGCSVALEVEDFDSAVAHLRANQVKFRFEPFTSPVCRMAGFFDPDGNSLIVHRRHAN